MTTNLKQQLFLKKSAGVQGTQSPAGVWGQSPWQKNRQEGVQGDGVPRRGWGDSPHKKTFTFFMVSFVDKHERKNPKIFSFSYKLICLTQILKTSIVSGNFFKWKSLKRNGSEELAAKCPSITSRRPNAPMSTFLHWQLFTNPKMTLLFRYGQSMTQNSKVRTSKIEYLLDNFQKSRHGLQISSSSLFVCETSD